MSVSEALLPADKLGEILSALGNANRLQLLEQLRTPRILSEIQLKPGSVREGENPDRAISRQAVRLHLDRLIEIGVVLAQKGERATGVVEEYVVNHQRLFAISEEVRRLGALTPRREGWGMETMSERMDTPADEVAPDDGTTAPALVLVRGLDEGVAFPLTDATCDASGRWLIGRRRGLPVSLHYDPFVSGVHAAVQKGRAGLEVLGLPEGRNGTFVNFKPLHRGLARTLRTGDVVGVGKSLLLYREPA